MFVWGILPLQSHSIDLPVQTFSHLRATSTISAPIQPGNDLGVRAASDAWLAQRDESQYGDGWFFLQPQLADATTFRNTGIISAWGGQALKYRT